MALSKYENKNYYNDHDHDDVCDQGFDPYADSVGPGIYGGVVRRDAEGELVIGEQYQGNHNADILKVF